MYWIVVFNCFCWLCFTRWTILNGEISSLTSRQSPFIDCSSKNVWGNYISIIHSVSMLNKIPWLSLYGKKYSIGNEFKRRTSEILYREKSNCICRDLAIDYVFVQCRPGRYRNMRWNSLWSWLIFLCSCIYLYSGLFYGRAVHSLSFSRFSMLQINVVRENSHVTTRKNATSGSGIWRPWHQNVNTSVNCTVTIHKFNYWGLNLYMLLYFFKICLFLWPRE